MNATSMTMPDADLRVELPARGPVGMYCPDCRRGRDFHDLCRGLYLLYRQEPHRAQPKRCPSCPDLFYDLSAFEQPDDSLCREVLRSGKMRVFRAWWLLTIALGAIFLAGTASEWHHLIYRRGLDHPYQSVRDHLLLAGRLAWLSRDGRLLALATVLAFTFLGHVRQEHAERVRSVAVLALRGCGVGGGLHRGVRYRALRKGRE